MKRLRIKKWHNVAEFTISLTSLAMIVVTQLFSHISKQKPMVLLCASGIERKLDESEFQSSENCRYV